VKWLHLFKFSFYTALQILIKVTSPDLYFRVPQRRTNFLSLNMRFYASYLNLRSHRNSLKVLTKLSSRTSRTNLHTNSQRVKLNVLIQNKMSRACETYHISRILLIFYSMDVHLTCQLFEFTC